MSRRVSILAPGDTEAVPSSPRRASTPRNSVASVSRSSKASTASTASTSKRASKEAIEPEPKPKPEPSTPDESGESALVKVSMTDLFSDDCERYKKDCCCCHCIAVRRALRTAAFLKTPEGKRRLELKMHMKDLIMDINAITYTRQRIENRLHGEREYPPSANNSFPITITHVAPISSRCMSIDWYQHDDTYVIHYEIYIDEKRRKRVFNPRLTSTVILDVDMKRTHKIRMKAVPKKGVGSQPNLVDKLVCDVCRSGLSKLLDSDYFCQCNKKSEMDKAKEKYKHNACKTLVDFWKDSEFLYVPVCMCTDECTCDCFADKFNACLKY